MPASPRLWRHLGTASAIYGLLVYASLIAATSLHLDDGESVGSVLLFSAVTLVVFWVAHLFASTLAYHGDESATAVTLVGSVKHGIGESIGVLVAAVLPTIPLLLGTLGVLAPRRSVLIALFVATLILGLLGFLAFSLRHSRWWVRIVGAMGTALFGVVVIVLEGSLH
jgi:hypothetical protein